MKTVVALRFWKTLAVCHILAFVIALLLATISLMSPVDIGKYHYASPVGLRDFFLLLGIAHAMAMTLGGIVAGLLAYDAHEGGVIYNLRPNA